MRALSIDKIYMKVVEFTGRIKVNVLLNLKLGHFTSLPEREREEMYKNTKRTCGACRPG